MKLSFKIFIMSTAIFVVSCSAPKVLTDYKINAEQAELQGDYEKALIEWKQYFAQFPEMNDLDGEVYAQAAQTAWKAGDTEQAVAWFDQARYRDFASYEMYSTLSEIYRTQNNLSKELSALEFLKENFENEVEGVNSRLFSIYDEIDMTEKALNTWRNMNEEAKSTESNLEKYFELNKQLGNDEVCDSLSLALLELNPENVNGLEWNATKIYHQAEQRYQHEMAKYENNRTRSQYRILLKELDKVTADFRVALGYFEKLWELNPEARSDYAGYMSNIHLRFNDEQKATYYRGFVK
jgi:tetratricopeptide (TPR) repeat protein